MQKNTKYIGKKIQENTQNIRVICNTQNIRVIY